MKFILVRIIFILTGALLLLVGIVSLLDPQGTQMANDADPFAPVSGSFYFESIGMAVLGLGLVVLGYVKLFGQSKK